MLLVMIRLGVTGSKIYWVMYLLDLFEGRGENGKGNLVCVNGEPLDNGVNGSYVDVLLKHMVSMILVLWWGGPVLRNGYGK